MSGPSTASARGRFRALAVPLVLVALLLAGCGDDGNGGTGPRSGIDSTDAAESGALPDPCGLLDETEVEELIGPGAEMTPTDGTAIDEVAFRECQWETPDRALIGIAVIEGSARYDQAVELADSGSLVDTETIEDLGDGAVVAAGVSLESSGATGGRTARVLDGEVSWSVALKLPGETPTADVVDLAHTVLERT